MKVMPGLLLCFVMRYDAYKRAQLLQQLQLQGVDVKLAAQAPVPPLSRMSYFHCSLIGYFLGLLTATVSSEVFKAAQPALLYLVPFTLLPLLTMAYLKVCSREFMFNKSFFLTFSSIFKSSLSRNLLTDIKSLKMKNQ
jgi:signal peptide peptidase-like protein 3